MKDNITVNGTLHKTPTVQAQGPPTGPSARYTKIPHCVHSIILIILKTAITYLNASDEPPMGETVPSSTPLSYIPGGAK